MAKNFLIFGILIALIVVLTHSITKNQSGKIDDFNYIDENSQSGHLYEFTNKPVTLHFWASWCVPCREELPKLIDKAIRSPERVFLLISIDKDKQAMWSLLEPKRHQLTDNIVIIHDPAFAITRDHFKVDGFPETIILNKDKTIARHIYGAADWETTQ